MSWVLVLLLGSQGSLWSHGVGQGLAATKVDEERPDFLRVDGDLGALQGCRVRAGAA